MQRAADAFDTVDEPGRKALEAAGTERTYRRGEYLCIEGDPSNVLYVLRSGLLRVERSTRDGRVVLLELSGRGDLFGQLGVLDGTPRSAAALVIEDLRALVIPVDALTPLFEAHPQILVAITNTVVDRLRDLTVQLVESGERSIKARVAARIVALVDRTGHAEETGPFAVRMPISQQELAQWANLSREATAKALREMRDEGLLSTGRRRIDIHRIADLRRLARQAH